MKKIITLLSAFILISLVTAQEVDTLQVKVNNEITNDSLANLINEKLSISTDSLAILIDKKVNEVLEEVLYVDPLKGKVGGFEINPFALMASMASGNLMFYGGYSRFDIDEDAEIAFPFMLVLGNGMENKLVIDYQYRLFMGRNTPHKYRSGFYLMSGLRTAIYGEDYYPDRLEGFNIGATFGFGSRKFGETGWYWGWSIYGGRYLNTDWPIMNIEFFKFGKTF